VRLRRTDSRSERPSARRPCGTPGDYITKLPKADHTAEEWQAAIEALILAATSGGPAMFAGIGVMRTLNRHVERVFKPEKQDHHWGRRKLARDR
jgi:hypothetical protein